MRLFIILAILLAITLIHASSKVFLESYDEDNSNRIITGNITYGGDWYDTDGNLIQAHNSGIYREDDSDTFYLYGIDFTNATTADPFVAVKLYESKDFKNWKFISTLLTPETKGWKNESGGIETGCGHYNLLERPKIYYNVRTRKYIMYFHVTNPSYTNTRVGVASSSYLNEGWEFNRCYNIGGLLSWDIGLYVDDDKDRSTYLVYSSNANGETNGALRISKLTLDGLDVEIVDVATGKGGLESPVIFKKDGRYTLIVSHTTGWEPNDNVYNQAENIQDLLKDPFTRLIAPKGTKTYESQVTWVFPLKGRLGNYSDFVYMGDKFYPSQLNRSTYGWLPLDISEDKVQLVNAKSWRYEEGRFYTNGTIS